MAELSNPQSDLRTDFRIAREIVAARMGTALVSLLLLVFTGYGQAPSAEAHLGNGYRLVQDERWEEAAKEFRAALAINPSLSRARYQLAICLFALGDRQEARQEFDRVTSEAFSAPSVTYYLGRLDLLAGNNVTAISRLSSISREPPFPDTLFYLGCAYLASGDTKQAIAALQRAATASPFDFRVRYRLARALEKAGRKTEAEREYGTSTQAREHYNQAAREATACSQALKSQPLDEARELCQRMFDPNDPDKLTMLGMLYGESGHYQDALKPLKEASLLDPDSFEVFHDLGLSYFRLRRFNEARAPLEKAILLRPDFFGSNALLGATLFILKQDEKAYAVLTHAHDLDPESKDTADLLFKEALLLGQRSYLEKDYTRAEVYLRAAARIRPENQLVRNKLIEISPLLNQK